MTAAELAQGMARNNERAMDSNRWRLRWMFQRVVPTGSFFTVFFAVPDAATLYRFEYILLAWPVTGGAFRPLFVEVADERGQKNMLLDPRKTELSRGMNAALFTTPTTDPNSALAGDQAAYLGTRCFNLEFPARASIAVNIRGALATPNPSTLDIMLSGYAKRKD